MSCFGKKIKYSKQNNADFTTQVKTATCVQFFKNRLDKYGPAFLEFSDKTNQIKRIAVFELTISCVRDRDDTNVPQRHR